MNKKKLYYGSFVVGLIVVVLFAFYFSRPSPDTDAAGSNDKKETDTLVKVDAVQANLQSTISLKHIQGDVYVIKNDSDGKKVKASEKNKLVQGDTLQTNKKSSVQLVFNNKEKAVVGEDSKVVIKELYATNGGKHVVLKQLSGSIWHMGDHKDYTVETPTVKTIAEGTFFLTGVNASTQSMNIFVGSGVVRTQLENQDVPSSEEIDPIEIYPSQQVNFYNPTNSSSDPSVQLGTVDPASLVEENSPAIIEALIRNKAEMDQENKEFLKKQQDLLGQTNPGFPSSLIPLDSQKELNQFQQNLENLTGNIVKQALKQNKIDRQTISQIIQQLNSKVQNPDQKLDLDNVSPLNPMKGLDAEQIMKRQAELERLEQQRKQKQAEQQAQQEQLQQQHENLFNKIQQQLEQQQKANEQAKQKEQAKAAEKYAQQLEKQQQKQLEEQIAKEKRQKAEKQFKSLGQSFKAKLNALGIQKMKMDDSNKISFNVSLHGAQLKGNVDDSKVAEASVDGTVLTIQAKRIGTATVTVTLSKEGFTSVSQNFKVIVSEKENTPPEIVNSIADQTLLFEDGKKTIHLNGVFADADQDPLTYLAESEDEGIAKVSIVDSNLQITPVSAGKITLTVTVNDGKGGFTPDTFTIVVKGVPEFGPKDINFTDSDLDVGEVDGQATVEKAASEEDVTSYTLYWSNSDHQKLEKITAIKKTGDNVTYTFPKNTQVPEGAIGLLAVSANSTGESRAYAFSTFEDRQEGPFVANPIADQTVATGQTLLPIEIPLVFKDAEGGYIGDFGFSSLYYLDVTSSDESIASAYDDGGFFVEGYKAGTAIVTVTLTNTDNGQTVSDSFTVEVSR